MKFHRLLLLAIPFFLFAYDSPERDSDQTTTGKWVSLFNGKNLDGWKPKFVGEELGKNFGNTFRVDNGVLTVRYDQYKSFDNKFGSLYYDRRLSDYRLKVEYRFTGETTAGAPSWGFRDSGIQYFCQAPSSIGKEQPFPVCLEFNLHGGDGKKDRPVGEVCAIGTYFTQNEKRNTSFCTPPTVKRTIHGDEWVTIEIDVRQGKVRHFVNGEEILAFENPKLDPTHDIARTLINNGDNTLKGGYISLQSNSHPIDFRKIEIMEY